MNRRNLSARQQWVGAVACYLALVMLAMGSITHAVVVVSLGLGAVFVEWQIAHVGSSSQTQGGGGGPLKATQPKAVLDAVPLPLFALIIWPVVSLLLVIPLALATGEQLDELPVGLVPAVIGMACIGAGFFAVKRGAPDGTHGWWALGGGASAVVLAGTLFWVLSA